MIKDILEAYTDGVAPDTFRDRIKATPTDIADLYAKILERVKEQDREASAAILRLAAFQPAEFCLNTLACAWLDNLLKDANFPCNEPAEVYSDDKVNKWRKRAIQRLAALTHGILEAQHTENIHIFEIVDLFFGSEIVFLHRTAQDFIRGLLMRDAEEAAHDILPWLQGSDNVSGNNWSQCWRTNLFVRVFHSEVRFGMLRGDDYGKPHEDLWDFGFWADDVSQLDLSDFAALSDFSSFSLNFRSSYWKARIGVAISNSKNIYHKTRDKSVLPGRFSVQYALFRGQDVSSWIQKRHPSRRLSSRIALSYTALLVHRGSVRLDGLKWLLQNKRVCATDERPVWHSTDDGKLFEFLIDARKDEQGHVGEDCSCGDLDASPVQVYRRWVQIWLIFLRVFGNGALEAAERAWPLAQGQFEIHCEMLELWLRYGAATDAVILIVPKGEEYTVQYRLDRLCYVEIEQFIQLGERPLNFQILQSLLAKQHKSWVSWLTGWLLWAWTSRIIRWVICAWACRTQFPKKTNASTLPIRKRYRKASVQELSLLDWEVYGVVSDDDELIGEFWYIVA